MKENGPRGTSGGPPSPFLAPLLTVFEFIVLTGRRLPNKGRGSHRPPPEPADHLVHGPFGLVPAALLLVQCELAGRLADWRQILHPDPDQTELYPFQAGPLIQLARCGVDHTSEVRGFGQRTGPGRGLVV